MKNLKTILALLIFAFCILSCSKDDEDALEKTSPAVEQYRIKEQLYPSGDKTLYEYNDKNKLTKSISTSGFFTKYTYNSNGRVETYQIGGLTNVALNHTATYTYDQSGGIAEQLEIYESGVKYKYIYTNNSSGFALSCTSYKWDTASNTFIEVPLSFYTKSYNTANQLLRFQRGDDYILYAYDDRGNQTENKTFKKVVNGGYYNQNLVTITFDTKRAIKTSPYSNRINNQLELSDKRFSEDGAIISNVTFTFSYDYNEVGYPIKKYLNGILNETNIFEKINL